jgi:hypothetical protein
LLSNFLLNFPFKVKNYRQDKRQDEIGWEDACDANKPVFGAKK